ncbi:MULTISPECIES: cobalamin biosynthesis protein [Streptomyces]|uniref:cobalamin biosynthesis protein n=1 Tax=Streptomyces TaxID=1883 RepID=UPI0024A3FAA5|nr:cobalamin biosynthesis protein [Streptomyces sp. NBRC 13847]GLW13331.1 hypothetical protein Stsp01_00740 [Streptomyces sp. NBRC 13847]
MSRRAAGGAGAEPLRLAAGVGARPGVPAGEVLELLGAALAAVGGGARIVALATVAARAAEPGLRAAAHRLGVPLLSFPAAELAAVRVPEPSAVAAAAVGTASVAEAAALLAAGPGAELVSGKRKSAPRGRPARATCALAGPAVTDKGGRTAEREGAAEAPSRAADIVKTSSHPPRPGSSRRTAVVGGPAPDSTTTGTKETQ